MPYPSSYHLGTLFEWLFQCIFLIFFFLLFLGYLWANNIKYTTSEASRRTWSYYPINWIWWTSEIFFNWIILHIIYIILNHISYHMIILFKFQFSWIKIYSIFPYCFFRIFFCLTMLNKPPLKLPREPIHIIFKSI